MAAGATCWRLVPIDGMGGGHAYYSRRRAGPGGLLRLGDLSFAGIFYRLGAGELGAVDCAAADAARAALRALIPWQRVSGWEKQFTGKLVEINLVMGIVKLALIVLAMVLSAAPLPFSDQLGADALHWVDALAVGVLSCSQRLFSGGAAERVSGVLEDVPGRARERGGKVIVLVVALVW